MVLKRLPFTIDPSKLADIYSAIFAFRHLLFSQSLIPLTTHSGNHDVNSMTHWEQMWRRNSANMQAVH
jgi:hypothetical protein